MPEGSDFTGIQWDLRGFRVVSHWTFTKSSTPQNETLSRKESGFEGDLTLEITKKTPLDGGVFSKIQSLLEPGTCYCT